MFYLFESYHSLEQRDSVDSDDSEKKLIQIGIIEVHFHGAHSHDRDDSPKIPRQDGTWAGGA